MKKNQSKNKPVDTSSRKDVVLVVGMVAGSVVRDFANYREKQLHRGKKLGFVLFHNTKVINPEQKKTLKFFDKVVNLNFSSPSSIIKALLPFEDRLLATTCRAESQIPNFAKVIPHVSYLRTPTSESLQWATEKILMRRRFRAYDRLITPEYAVVTDDSEESINHIAKKIGFPLIIKPSGLAQSLLVTMAYHKEELARSLKKIFKKINRIYKEVDGRGQPQLLVEQFLDGDMYSVDAYVDTYGKIYFCPPVYVKTGQKIGFDDFFGYLQMTPTALNTQSIKAANEVTAKAIRALGLKNSTAHVELMRTEKGWKIVELGPRIGGFRTDLYRLAYGIDHTANDINIRIPKKIKISKRVKGYAAAMKVFAKNEGRIKNISGLRKVQQLESFYSISVNKKIGDMARYAKHGGKSVFNLILFNKERSRLLADIRRMEQSVKIKTK